MRGLSTSVRVPRPPGTRKTSARGALSKEWSAITRRPLAERTSPPCSQTVKTSHASGSSAASMAKTSHGPTKSSSSAPGKMTTAIVRFTVWPSSRAGCGRCSGISVAAGRDWECEVVTSELPPRWASGHDRGMAETEAGALDRLRMVDLSDSVGGAYWARLLGDLGADVIKVEPPGGDPLRRQGPFLGDQAGAERGLLFQFLNFNKRGAVLDPAEERDRVTLHSLLEQADVV